MFLSYCRHWLKRRDEEVTYKGKGVMTTYWCEPVARTEEKSTGASDKDQEVGNGNTIMI
jgi:hypothetical protein